MTKKTKIIKVIDSEISISTYHDMDYISLTDMSFNYGGSSTIERWLRNKDTLEFLGAWEAINNPDFNSLEFEGIKNQAGTNRFWLSVKGWSDKTCAIGLKAKTGRHHAGTYAHRDIAFEFGAWLSPEFKLYLIKEFQRLKEDEAKRISEGWDYRRFLSKVNYKLHTDSVKNNLIPTLNISKNQEWLVYAEEADLLNMALFNETAQDWRANNPEKAKIGENIRDSATVVQLTVLSNLENFNAIMIADNIPKAERFNKLQVAAIFQMKSLLRLKNISPDQPKELE
jgi:hypothetical protein